MIDHYSTAGTNMLIKQKWLQEKHGCGDERYVRGELFVCMQCAKGAIGHCENVLGYLPLVEHCQYMRDTTVCNK
jgi:hypothetical protein